MFKSFLAVALVAAATLLSASAFAQTTYPQANAPVYTPPSIAHQQAQAAGVPDQCGAVTAKAQNSVSLRLQQYNGQPNRGNVNAFLDTARDYAALGNEEQCWHWFDRAQQVP
jgi:hypothetical protein